MTNIFKNKLDRIDNIIKGERDVFSNATGAMNEALVKGHSGVTETNDEKVVAKVDYGEIQNLFGTHKFSFLEPKIGPHPDFNHLHQNQSLNHYAVSMFCDIKGSTLLSKKYSLHQIRQIKDTILTLAIEVCSFFGGHIHRLQGDGVFVYFVRSEMNPKDAIINALNASALLNYFMKYQLPQYFEGEEIKTPQIRVGIDYGNAEQTLWSYYGLAYCSELTTTGLHTDLAAKLQGKSPANGIMIGDNIVRELDLQERLAVCDPTDKFIFDNNYKKYLFKWENYLLSYDFIKKDNYGGLIMEKPKYKLNCEIAENENGIFYTYHQNLYSIPKKFKIRFTLLENEMEYKLKVHFKEHINWKIVNTGKEAKNAEKLNQEMKEFDDKTSCIVNAEFLGHHDMQCKIIKSGSIQNINVRYPVFVQ